jgi:hypothetical protein
MSADDLKDRLMAVHLANASDTSATPLAKEEDPLVGFKGVVKSLVWGACAWAIVGACYLLLTGAGG